MTMQQFDTSDANRSRWTAINARVVTPEKVLSGGMVVEQGVITNIGEVKPGPQEVVVDFRGDYLLPGCIDIHTDNLEKHFFPRPGVYWEDSLAAVQAHDMAMVAAGVTTVFDSLCAEAFPLEAVRVRMFHDAIAGISACHAAGLFKVEHLLHIRCETADPEVLTLFRAHRNHPLLRLVSLMDHTPGQRQYRDENKFREYYGAEGWTDAEFRQVVSCCKSNQARYACAHRQAILEDAQAQQVPLASHDDATAAHVAQAHQEGITISEFPTTLEAARHAKALGMAVVMGAPNILRGGSHSGNVAALDVLQAGALDVLASDYVPQSMLAVPFHLHARHGVSLPEAVRLVSANPAACLGLDDRGELAPGKRADCLRVQQVEGSHIIRAVWRSGGRVI